MEREKEITAGPTENFSEFVNLPRCNYSRLSSFLAPLRGDVKSRQGFLIFFLFLSFPFFCFFRRPTIAQGGVEKR